MLTVRRGNVGDIDEIMRIFDAAKKFMVSTGNLSQWNDGYPQRELMLEEIGNGHCYVCENAKGAVVGTFCFWVGIEPTYEVIDGCWLNDEPYGVIHRLASDGTERGVANECLRWCAVRAANLRIDTHADNLVMQSILKSNGFSRCGIIRVRDGSPRIAYQKSIGICQ